VISSCPRKLLDAGARFSYSERPQPWFCNPWGDLLTQPVFWSTFQKIDECRGFYQGITLEQPQL